MRHVPDRSADDADKEDEYLDDEDLSADDDDDDEDLSDDDEGPSDEARSFPFRGAVPVLLLLLIWGVGAWVWWNVAIGYGWNQSSIHLRSGTMTVASCHRSPAHAFVLYTCSGAVRLAPEDTWQPGSARLLRDRQVRLLSRTPLSGEVDFFTFDPRGSQRDWSSNSVTEAAMPMSQEIHKATWGVIWPPLATGIGVLVAGVLMAIGAHRILSIWDMNLPRRTLRPHD